MKKPPLILTWIERYRTALPNTERGQEGERAGAKEQVEVYRDGSSVTLTFLIPTSIYRSFSFQLERPDPGANSCEQVQATTARGVSPIARGDGGGGSPEAADTGGGGRRGGEHVGPLMVYHQR